MVGDLLGLPTLLSEGDAAAVQEFAADPTNPNVQALSGLAQQGLAGLVASGALPGDLVEQGQGLVGAGQQALSNGQVGNIFGTIGSLIQGQVGK